MELIVFYSFQRNATKLSRKMTGDSRVMKAGNDKVYLMDYEGVDPKGKINGNFEVVNETVD